MTEAEIIALLPSVISKIPLYGEFYFEKTPFNPAIQPITLAPNLLTNIQNIQAHIAQQNRQIDELFEKEEEVVQYLIFNGFVTNRHDIKEPGKLFRQLTERGRILKDLGSIHALRLREADQALEAKRRVDWEEAFRKITRRTFGWTIAAATVAALILLWDVLKYLWDKDVLCHPWWK